jgi:hypothetical protein
MTEAVSIEDVYLATIVSWTPAVRDKVERAAAKRIFGGDRVAARGLVDQALEARLLARDETGLAPTKLGRRKIHGIVPSELGVEGADVGRLIVRAYVTGLTVDRVTRSQLKSVKLVRAYFVAKRLFLLDVPIATTTSRSISRCVDMVACEWARHRLESMPLAQLQQGISKKLKQRIFCTAAGINDFDTDAGFTKLISNALSRGFTSESDSDWTLFRAMRDMVLSQTQSRADGVSGPDDRFRLIADAIGSVTAKSLSKWALVADVFRALPRGAYRDVITFKQSLIDFVERGSLELSPVVVQGSVAANDREMSELTFGGRQFHFVRIRRN